MALPAILYDNRLLDGTPTATDTAAGYDVLNIRDYRTYTWWQANSFGTKYITVDCGSAKSVDALAIIGHNLFTANATVSVESSATGAWAGEEVVRLAGFTPTSDKAIFRTFNSASARYWRIKIVTAAIAARLAVVFMGAKLEMPYPPDAPYRPFSKRTEAMMARSKVGHFLGAVTKFFPYDIAPTFSNLLRTFVFGDFQTFWDNHASLYKPFFYAWDIDVFSSHVFYCVLQEGASFDPPLSTLQYVDRVSLPMNGVWEV